MQDQGNGYDVSKVVSEWAVS